MKCSFAVSRTALVILCAGCFLTIVSKGAAQSVPTMTIEIHNNSDSYNIYPVLSTGGHGTVDTWMQAAFHVPHSELAANPYPTPNTFRLYLNPTGVGIAPHGSITVTLPLHTQLVPTGNVDPTLPDQFIDWWNGGRILIYASPSSDAAPPKALVADYTARPNQKLLTPAADAAVPTCSACQQPVQLFEDFDGELPSNDPAQLIEYTLGAIDMKTDPYTLDVENVDYDVSYVDNVYLPAAIEPFNNPVVGWIGTIQEIDPFKNALLAFLTSFTGWPQFVDNQGETLLRIPSALHIMQDQTNLAPAPPWIPVENMRNLWNSCATGGTEEICTKIRHVRDLFEANYKSYTSNYRAAFSGACDQSKALDPATLDQNAMLAHVYAWTPFNANCSAGTNLLEDTAGYAENNYAGYQSVKAEFDNLNYSGDFNPYVKLIHDQQYLDAKYVYAYSVDDAVGNMQTSGQGLIIAVGGAAGLPNSSPAASPIHIPFGFAATDAVRFVKYGVCTDTPDRDVNPNFTSFDLSATQISDCTLSFVDNNKDHPGLYRFKITEQPPYPPLPPNGQLPTDNNKKMIDCSGNTDVITRTWCVNIFGYTQGAIGAHSKEDDYISVPAPAQMLPEEPNGVVEVAKLSVSGNSVSPGDSVALSTILTAKGAVSDVSVTFYDGNPKSGGQPFATEQIPSIAANSQHPVQTNYQADTCGVHQLFAVVNRGKSTEIVRRAQPLRVDCTASR